MFDMVLKTPLQGLIGTNYSRVDQVKISKSCLPQILLGPLLNIDLIAGKELRSSTLTLAINILKKNFLVTSIGSPST